MSRVLMASASASSTATASSSTQGGTAIAEAVASAAATGDAEAIADAISNATSDGGEVDCIPTLEAPAILQETPRQSPSLTPSRKLSATAHQLMLSLKLSPTPPPLTKTKSQAYSLKKTQKPWLKQLRHLRAAIPTQSPSPSPRSFPCLL